ncbi:MAG: response regulator [Deltaproteobacteria bacterium]|nr:response regulator [Deltaproteobacteria bacterium]
MATVMAVDDSRLSLLGIKRHLEGTEFELIVQARSGEEALAEYQAQKPDIVLLDIVMPDMDGVAVLERLRALDGEAKVIMVSSLGTKEKVMECMEKGASSFLMKPYDQDGLLQVLRAAGGGAA